MKKLNQCKKADIFDQERQLISTASVEVDPMDNVNLVVPRSVDFQREEPYLVIFYDPNMGLLTCKCQLKAPVNLTNDRTSFRCDILEEISREQRRMDVKAPLSVPVMITLVGEKKSDPATVLNISAGGAYITSELSMNSGERFTFEFTEAGTAISLMVRILRVEELTDEEQMDGGKPLYGYGCQFLQLSPQQEEQLRSYVFQQEALRIRSQRGK